MARISKDHIEVFQKYTVELMNEKSFRQYAIMTVAMTGLDSCSSEITAETPGKPPGTVPICWERSLNVIGDICERMLQSQGKNYSARQLIETPYRLAHSKISRPPIVIEDIYLSGSESEQPRTIGGFCATQFNVIENAIIDELGPEFAEAFGNNVAQVIKITVKLLAWISRRYYEVMIFQRLQNASNRLGSFSTDEEVLGIARALFEVLIIGSMEMCSAKDSFQYNTKNSGKESWAAYDHRKQKIRQALFIYFSIALDKVPPGYDFWLLVRSGHHKSFPNLSRHHLTDLEAFDQSYQREITKLHRDIFYKEEVDSEGIRDPSDEKHYNHITANLDSELRLGIFGEIFSGPRNAQADLEAILKRFSDIYQPKIEGIDRLMETLEELVSNAGPDPSSSPLWQEVKDLALMGRAMQQSLEKQLEKQRGSQEPRMYGDDVDALITQALDIMGLIDRVLSFLTTTINGVFKTLEYVRMMVV